MSRLLIILLLLAGHSTLLPAQDKGYKVVRPDGTVEFSDQLAPGAQAIPLPKAQGYQAPQWSPPAATPESVRPKTDTTPYRQLSITAPAPEETLRGTAGTVSVNVHLEPALHAGHLLVIRLDGKEVGRGRTTQFTLTEVERGTHVLGAEVQDAQGKSVQSSSTVTFFVFQHSLLHKKAP